MVDVTAAGCTIAGLDGGKTELEDGPMTGAVGSNAELAGIGSELVGTGAELIGIGAELVGTGAEFGGTGVEFVGTGAGLVGTGAELMVTSAELVETIVGTLGTEKEDEAPKSDDNESELLLGNVGIIENPGKEGVLVKLPDVIETEGAGRE